MWEWGGESSRKDWPGDRSCAPYGFAPSPPDSVAFLYGVTWVTSCAVMFLHRVTPWQHRVQLCSMCARPGVTPFQTGPTASMRRGRIHIQACPSAHQDAWCSPHFLPCSSGSCQPRPQAWQQRPMNQADISITWEMSIWPGPGAVVGVGWQGDHSSRPQTREEVETETCPSALARENCHGFEMRA